MAYQQLTMEQRIIIASLRRKGVKVSDIAREIGKNKSTVSRELARNSSPDPGIGYLWEGAEWKTKERRDKANQHLRKIEEGSWLALYIFEKLRSRWSPEQIHLSIKEDGDKELNALNLSSISFKTVYTFIEKEHPEFLCYLLLRSHHKRRPKGSGKRELIKNRRWIETRPKEIEERKTVGDWEGDTIVSGCRRKAIATFDDRASNYMLAGRMEGRGAQEMKQVTCKLFIPLPQTKRRTCTNDNGPEFALHQETEKELNLMMYFAHPYHSWERGINENGNRELRRFFPKRTRFADIEDWELDWAVNLINNRPRKRLGNRTPYQVFHEA